MVISSSNRAPSPMSTRPNSNPSPNSRTLHEREGVIPARKSFSGYPLGKPSIISQPRSFIPNTPANSPAEYARRSLSRDHEQKENEDHHNSKSIVRPRSPSVTKGSKNFMSPTISAASKMNPSPRKKVLGERNEAIRTSASLSDGKFQFFSTSSLEFYDENEPRTDTETPATDFLKVPEKNVLELSSEPVKVESEPDLVVLSPEVPSNTTNSSDQPLPLSEMPKTDAESTVGLDATNTCSSPSIIAPLDADPSLPPYDPKTNFLSPRPQFLRYKPNPRIESYIINQGLSLEDEFGSEANSETENSEETQSETSAKEQDSSSSSSSSSETSPLQEKPLATESNSTDTQKLQEAIEAKVEPKPQFFTRWKALSFVLIILLGFITFSVTYDPSFENAIFGEEVIFKAYNDPHVVVDLAKTHFNGLSQSVKLFSAYSLSHLSQFIHSSREVNFTPLVYSNLTGWQEEEDYVVGEFEMGSFFERKEDRDFFVGDYELSSFVQKDGQEATMASTENFASNPETEEQEPPDEESSVVKLDDSEPQKVEENSVPLPMDQGEDSPVDVEEPYVGMMDQGEDSPVDVEDPSLGMMDQKLLIDEAENQEVECVQVETDISVDFLDESHIDFKAQSSSSYSPEGNQEVECVQVETDISVDFLDKSHIDVEAQSSPSYSPEVHPEVLTSSEPPLAKDDQSSSNDIDTKQMVEEAKSDSEMLLEPTPENSQLLGLSERSLIPIIAAVIFGAVSLLTAATAFIFMKPKKDNLVISAPLAHRLPAKEKSVMEKSVASAMEPLVHEYAPSWSSPVEVDMISEPCPSEMSSFQKTSSYSERSERRGADEAQSQSVERRPKRDHKRESLASSSSEYTMCSYGSFTTYNKIPSKKGDEEVVTPVRRSSRIRNQVTSP